MKWLCIVLLLPGMAFAGENCTTYGGVCKASCEENEVIEEGAFIDCTTEQDCCVVKVEKEEIDFKCCIYSFNFGDFSKKNCGIPENNLCEKGTGSPIECSELDFCRDK